MKESCVQSGASYKMTRLSGEEATSLLRIAIKERNARETDAFRELIDALSVAQRAKNDLQRSSSLLAECVPVVFTFLASSVARAPNTAHRVPANLPLHLCGLCVSCSEVYTQRTRKLRACQNLPRLFISPRAPLWEMLAHNKCSISSFVPF